MKVSFIDALREARATPRTVLTRVRSDYSRTDLSYHAFFEGRADQSFFMTFVEHHRPRRIRLFTYRCGGKAKVHELSDALNLPEYDRKRFMFFVDKDMEDLLGEKWKRDERFFVTAGYSIENYVACQEVFARMMKELMHLDLTEEEEQTILAQFVSQLERFTHALLLISAWILYIRESGLRANLNNIDLDKLFQVNTEFEPTSCVSGLKQMLGYLERATGTTLPQQAHRKIVENGRKLRSLEPKIYTRGKFELWFVVECARKLPDLFKQAPDADGKHRIRRFTDITHSNAVEQLGPRTPEPPSLRTFLTMSFT